MLTAAAAVRLARTSAGAQLARGLSYSKYPFLRDLGLNEENHGVFNGQWGGSGDLVTSVNPATGEEIARVRVGTPGDYETTLAAMEDAKKVWQSTPMVKRGEIVRQIGNELRLFQAPLAKLVSLEMGKIAAEGEGEVQEYIDIADFAVGLSRQIGGSVFPSERPDHTMMEMWHPLGHIGIITAFNFPVAVFGWNSALAMVCGNTSVWCAGRCGGGARCCAYAMPPAMTGRAPRRPTSRPSP